MKNFKDISIKAKLIILFIVLKLIPLFIISYLAIVGIIKLHNDIKKSNEKTLEKSINSVEKTADIIIEDSIKVIDKNTQSNLEIRTVDIANKVADFLYERDNDLIFLSKQQNISKKMFQDFFDSKVKKVIIPRKFIYDDNSSKWVFKNDVGKVLDSGTKAKIKENQRYFNHNKVKRYRTKEIKIYKEISFIDLKGNEIIKVSSIDEKLKNISLKKNTYIKAEDYFSKLKELKKDEIYVSNVIGEYVGSKIVGTFTKQKAKELKIEFEPEKYAYAGVENPVGKKFEGIIRFAIPKYTQGKKVGYITFALDHRHIMEFTDYITPSKQNFLDYSDASSGNYAFMWDNKGRSISHPRDYFIVGYDSSTGKKVKPLLDEELALKIKQSGINWEDYLKKYPVFEAQTSNKKINLSQVLEEGKLGVDCRYLNFAPQCSGWMNISKDGGYGSFVVQWLEMFKLTTVAVIPYYTGQYKNTKRGFGFVTVGENLDELRQITNKTKKTVDNMMSSLRSDIVFDFKNIYKDISEEIKELTLELIVVTFLMTIAVVVIAIVISNYLTSSINILITGIKKFANKDFSHRVKIKSKDEIGVLGDAFNNMAKTIQDNMQNLDDEVVEKNKELKNKNLILEEAKKIAKIGEWELMLDNYESRWSDNVFTMFGLDKDRVSISKELLSSLMYEEDWNEFLQMVRESIKNKTDFFYTYRIKKADDSSTVWFDCKGKYITSKNSILGTIQDVTKVKVKQKQMKNYMSLIDKNIITCSMDMEGNITHVSSAFCNISGYLKEELIGKHYSFIKADEVEGSFYDDIWEKVDKESLWEGEIKKEKLNKEIYWVKSTISPMLDENNNKIGYTAIMQNITDRKIIEEISIKDGLTSIYNRRHFNEVFPFAINSAKRDHNSLCLAMIDIDFFKQYNDTYGHQMGDYALIEVAKKLKTSLLRSDDYCFRLGGEEFALLFKAKEAKKALMFVDKIRQNIENLHIEHEKNTASPHLTISVGFVYKNIEETDKYDEIFSLADKLLYEAKKSGRNRVVSNI